MFSIFAICEILEGDHLCIGVMWTWNQEIFSVDMKIGLSSLLLHSRVLKESTVAGYT